MSRWSVLTYVVLSTFICAMFLVYGYTLFAPSKDSALRRFCSQRTNLMVAERSSFLGSNLVSSETMREDTVKLIFQRYKISDLSEFLPSQNFLKVRAAIEKRHLYGHIRTMPKGGALRVHDIGMCSVQQLLKFTYMNNLWVCVAPHNNGSYEKLMFALRSPDIVANVCEWQLAEQMRRDMGADTVDRALAKRMTIDMETYEALPNNVAIQAYIDRAVSFIRGLVTYYPVWNEYIYRSIEQFHSDSLQYMEIRSSFPNLYDMVGRRYDQLESAKVIHRQAEAFVKEHADFVGVRVIYEPTNDLDGAFFSEFANTYSTLKCALGDFLIGFGWSTLNESAHQLNPHAALIIENSPLMDYYFTVGKSNMLFSENDNNIGDALLLGGKRIGNGYILAKHIAFQKYGKNAKIPVEVCPISDQMFRLVVDLRNHAGCHLLIHNYPIVIGSDYPGLWGARPASHDFYMMYVGMSNAWDDLLFLKQMALNSFKYSGLSQVYRNVALMKFEMKWTQWIANITA